LDPLLVKRRMKVKTRAWTSKDLPKKVTKMLCLSCLRFLIPLPSSMSTEKLKNLRKKPEKNKCRPSVVLPFNNNRYSLETNLRLRICMAQARL
jgi:hypothetical protein